MPPVARGKGKDSVKTNHGCTAMTKTSDFSTNVIVNSIGVHRKSDKNAVHTYKVGDNCPSHQTAVSVGSITVFANSLGVARIGDKYTGGEEVNSGSSNVFSG
jgi:uncharacterized Zn-binding protein involved in type VI secretion